MTRRLTFLITLLIALAVRFSPVRASVETEGQIVPPAGAAVDQVISTTGDGTISTPSFGTKVPGEVIVAFAASDGPRSGEQTLTVSGAGLPWSLVRRANGQLGTSEIWMAVAPSVLSGISVT